MSIPARPELIPRIGVGVILVRDANVLLGRRLGSHGAGTWALPGGHLEFGETVAHCAAREVREETGILVTHMVPAPYIESIAEKEQRHYVTLFVQALEFTGEAQAREPDKCAAWGWYCWSVLPQPLFAPLFGLVTSGFIPHGIR